MIFSEQLIHLIDEFAKRIGIIIDWTNDNIMPYLCDLITRYGQFHLAINSIMFMICLLVVILCARGWLKVVECLNSGKLYVLFDLEPIVAIPLLTATILSPICLFHFGYQMIQLLFIPEWFILEQLLLLKN